MFVSKDVSFNESDLLKKGESFESTFTNNGKCLFTNVVVSNFDHSITNRLSQEGAPMHVEKVLEEHE